MSVPSTIEPSLLLDQVYRDRDVHFYPAFKGYQRHPLVLSKLLNPGLTGESPMWPNWRQSHVLLVRDDRILIISEGLSDVPTAIPTLPLNGLGFEVFGEFPVSASSVSGGGEEFSLDDSGQWVHTWQAAFTDRVTQIIASNGRRVVELLQQLGSLSLEIPHENIGLPVPPHLITNNGRCAVVVFFSNNPNLPAYCQLPTGRVELIGFRLINQTQLDHILADGEQGRLQLCNSFVRDGSYHLYREQDFM